MSFVCPACLEVGSLEIAQAMQLPQDACSGDLMLQVVECVECRFCGLAVYSEARHSALDTLDWKHIGYRIDPADLAAVRHLLRSCPDPLNSGCDCDAHLRLAQQDQNGCWQGLAALIDIEGDFVMRLIH